MLGTNTLVCYEQKPNTDDKVLYHWALKGLKGLERTNPRPGWKGLPGTNTLSYYEQMPNTYNKVLYHWALKVLKGLEKTNALAYSVSLSVTQKKSLLRLRPGQML
jgi:hypothetical protein